MLTLYVTDTVHIETDRMDGDNEKVRLMWKRMYMLKTGFRTATTILKYLFVTAMVAVMMWRMWVDKDKPGVKKIQVAAALFVTLTVDGVVYSSVIDYIDMLQEAADLQKTEIFFDGVAAHKYPAPPPGRTVKTVDTGEIVYRSVTVRYEGRETDAISGVDLVIQPGDRILISGHIGSGKSTVTKLLAGLHPYTGSLTIGGDRAANIPGHEVRALSSSEIALAVTYIPQTPRLFNRTVIENILAGFEDRVSRSDIEGLLAWLNIPNFPPLDTVAGKSGSQLSGGQRTIVYLIRGFLRRTPIVVLDEPTASLDPRTRDAVIHVINTLFRASNLSAIGAAAANIVRRVVGTLENRTLLIISHDTVVNWGVTRRMVVAKGKVTMMVENGAVPGAA
jgi:ABC-type multidrug transport system fused ATPase/permease subunit